MIIKQASLDHLERIIEDVDGFRIRAEARRRLNRLGNFAWYNYYSDKENYPRVAVVYSTSQDRGVYNFFVWIPGEDPLCFARREAPPEFYGTDRDPVIFSNETGGLFDLTFERIYCLSTSKESNLSRGSGPLFDFSKIPGKDPAFLGSYGSQIFFSTTAPNQIVEVDGDSGLFTSQTRQDPVLKVFKLGEKIFDLCGIESNDGDYRRQYLLFDTSTKTGKPVLARTTTSFFRSPDLFRHRYPEFLYFNQQSIEFFEGLILLDSPRTSSSHEEHRIDLFMSYDGTMEPVVLSGNLFFHRMAHLFQMTPSDKGGFGAGYLWEFPAALHRDVMQFEGSFFLEQTEQCPHLESCPHSSAEPCICFPGVQKTLYKFPHTSFEEPTEVFREDESMLRSSLSFLPLSCCVWTAQTFQEPDGFLRPPKTIAFLENVYHEPHCTHTKSRFFPDGCGTISGLSSDFKIIGLQSYISLLQHLATAANLHP